MHSKISLLPSPWHKQLKLQKEILKNGMVIIPCPNVLPPNTKLGDQLFQICDPFYGDGIINAFHQPIEMLEGIFVEPKSLVIIHLKQTHLTKIK
jgi:hypothetical protein